MWYNLYNNCLCLNTKNISIPNNININNKEKTLCMIKYKSIILYKRRCPN